MTHSAKAARRSVVILALTLLASGCESEGPPLVRVQGVVTLDGRPLAGKSVRFFPQADTPGVGAGANTGSDGSYDLIAVRPGSVKDVMGIPPGVYKVTVTEPIFPIDLDVPVDDSAEPAPAIGLPAARAAVRAAIPASYGAPESSPLRVEVTEQGGIFNLELTSRP